ncbi:paraquat-inducible protein B, putative [Oceaniovalibus guishaninsula JLT2003]|uniref:Paraquat-inducible protein B, putative n=1 Tax=Oceaniovalibus guishaninsula JLT2003 TaxID=1231392 RepID=K2HDV7_9RHOB|nr:MlaD family protein [Oceaniovalibus guishaninsula]EKE45638.1 paraquat-inducible protein B, putative [Oceaniovalibus guishaninsula JLT2003]
MTDLPPDAVPEPEIKPARRSLLDRVSVVWIVPIGALLISLGVVWQSWQDEGRRIEIEFDNASGVRAGETELRYRDVTVGIVEEVRFTDDLEHVLVEVRLDKEVGPFVDSDAQFWVVRPEVSARGVSGLETVLSGVFIEGSWDSVAGEDQDRFLGLSSPPLIRYGEEGLTIVLRSETISGLSSGTPILYRGIEVGKIDNLRLGEDGVSVVADAFIRAPESRLITSATRFWNTSGFSFSFGAQGAKLDVSSIAALLGGGVAFDTTVSGGGPVDPGSVFRLFPNEEAARNSVFAGTGGGEPARIAAIFEESVGGLEVGAKVDFNGIAVGEVVALTGLLDEDRFGDRQVRLLTTLEIRPGRLGLPDDSTADDVLEFLDFAVASGLRAQLQSASLLGGLQVGLVQLTDPPDADFDPDREPLPIIPTTPAQLSDFADTAQGVFNRVNNLPIEELLDSAIAVLGSVNALLNDEGVRETPDEVLGLLGDVRRLVASDSVQGIPVQASEVLASLQGTAQELESLVQSISEAGAVEALVAALEAAEVAADSVYETMDEAPETLDGIDAAVADLDLLINDIRDLPFDSIVASVDEILAEVNTLVAAPATQGLTGDVSALLRQTEGLLADIRGSNLIANANAALDTLTVSVTEIRTRIDPILDEALTAARSASTAIDGVPALVAQLESLASNLDAVVQDVDDLPLDTVVSRVNALLADVNALIAAPATTELPDALNQTVTQLRLLLTELREENLVGTAASALAATESAVTDLNAQLAPVLAEARRAAQAVADAADGTPELIARAQAVADELQRLVANANDLPLQELTQRASDVLASADTLIGSDDTARLPGALSDALGEVQRLLIEVQEGGLVENANSTLVSARQAADAIADASGELPTIVAQLNALLGQAEGVLSGYEASGALGSEARSTLRSIREAAKSVDSLSRTIERSPNSLLFGR